MADETEDSIDARITETEENTNQNTRKTLNEKLLVAPRSTEHARDNYDPERMISRPSIRELVKPEFYKNDNWLDVMMEILFKIKFRETTIKAEIYYGLIHFISCMYCLPVVPQQLQAAGYDSRSTVVVVAACSGIGSIFCGLFANLPFVIAPPTVVSIFLSVFLQQHSQGPKEGNVAVIISGVILMCFGWKPLFQFVAKLIPISIQVGTAVGIGLLTALAGSSEINLVVKGTYTILEMGNITVEIVIAIFGVLLICIAMVYHMKGAFCLAVVVCSLIWWIYDDAWPGAVFAAPQAEYATLKDVTYTHTPLLTADLVFLYLLYLNGLVTSLSNMAVLTREDGTAPRGRWIFIMSGAFTIISGLLSAPPMLISPESGAGIKAGAKTGLSTVVCGILFCLASFLAPVFEAVPAAATGPLLIMIGILLFQNVARLDWRNICDAAPAFVVLFYIPFTYSIIQGVILGYIVHIAIALSNGDFKESAITMGLFYFPSLEKWLLRFKRESLIGDHHTGESLSSNTTHNKEGGPASTAPVSFDMDSHKKSSVEHSAHVNATSGGGGVDMTMSMNGGSTTISPRRVSGSSMEVSLSGNPSSASRQSGNNKTADFVR